MNQLSMFEIEDEAQEARPHSKEDQLFSDEQIIEAAFRHYRDAGFPYKPLPIHICMEQLNALAFCQTESLLHSTLGYQIADTYNPHRFHSAAAGMRSPADSFEDDKSLRKAIKLHLDHAKDIDRSCLCMVNGTQACANFRPGFACKLYRDYCKPGDTVLDTSTGYGGRLVGFMASGIAGRYIGIDPNTQTHGGNCQMVHDLGFADRVKLYNLPAEDVPHELVADQCDFAFTSPPYFSKERYSDEETQSWKRYPRFDQWREGFLRKMLALQFAALKPGCISIVNIADVVVDNCLYSLKDLTRRDAIKAGFEHIDTLVFPMQRRFGTNDEEIATEPVLVFRKPA
jgi:hypothetical protein